MKRPPFILSIMFLLVGAGIFIASNWVMAAQGDIQGNIIFEGKGSAKELPSSHFPHWRHRIRYRCSVCHEELFSMERGANIMSMAKFKQGEFCGKCHNGQEAFNIEFNSCKRCHNPKVQAKP
ncbi:MAG: hypothetical protein OEY67_00810 [Gammaproteobacteria bacterium]|nr:hypothetical protein [Gammaproteobacteria bacterium]